jgi:hypothetical protein
VGVLVALVGYVVVPAGLLDPNDFPSLGVLPPGAIYVDTGNGSSISPTISNGLNVLAHGVISNGVAVFDFDSGSGGLQVMGSLPIAILSRGDLSMSLTELGNFSGYPGGGGGGGAPGGLGGPPGSPQYQSGFYGGFGAGNLL